MLSSDVGKDLLSHFLGEVGLTSACASVNVILRRYRIIRLLMKRRKVQSRRVTKTSELL